MACNVAPVPMAQGQRPSEKILAKPMVVGLGRGLACIPRTGRGVGPILASYVQASSPLHFVGERLRQPWRVLSGRGPWRNEEGSGISDTYFLVLCIHFVLNFFFL